MNLKKIYDNIEKEFDEKVKVDGMVNILNVLQHGLKKVDMDNSLPECYRLVENDKNYIEATWTFKDGLRTFDMKPDVHVVDIYLFQNGDLKASKNYRFPEDKI